MSHSLVAHRWFHQIGNKTTGSNSFMNGNMFYRNKIIYSYGHHFALGIRFEDTVILNSKGYSSSTSKHQGHTYNSIDNTTHKQLNFPFKDACYFNDQMEFKDAYKCIDFKSYLYRYEKSIKKLTNARKPIIYVSIIESAQSELKKIFALWRGSKTLALKEVPGLRKLLKFQFTEALRDELKKEAKKVIEKRAAAKKRESKWARMNLFTYEKGENLKGNCLRKLDINTAIRVKGDAIETTKGMKIDLHVGIRVFKLWQAGKALGVEINTTDGNKWSCTKVNGIIKFGCHEIQFEQAKRVLTQYL
jgi:hypothetical protein